MKSNVSISSYDKLVEEYIKTKVELEITQKELEKAQSELAALKGNHKNQKGSEKFYAVKIGRKPGIYTTWKECKKQVHKYDGAQFRTFKTLAEAETFIEKQEKNNYSTASKITNKMGNSTSLPEYILLENDEDLPF